MYQYPKDDHLWVTFESNFPIACEKFRARRVRKLGKVKIQIGKRRRRRRRRDERGRARARAKSLKGEGKR